MERKTHTIDAKGESMGRLATRIAQLLQGKHKATYVPYLDQGDEVKVENAGQMKVTGRKMAQKTYYRHSGYPGGLKEEKLETLFEKNPGEVLRRAVLGMLPKNKLQKERIKRLKIES